MELDQGTLDECTTFLFDIEGTVCSIAFVKDILYPYFVKELPFYIRANWNSEGTRHVISNLPIDVKREPQSASEHFLKLVRDDVKDPLLKELQGLIWTSGYDLGTITAPLYRDVIPAFRVLRKRNKRLGIYSSGSVHAQRLLFDHVDVQSFPSCGWSMTNASNGVNYASRDSDKRKSVSIVEDFIPESGTQPLFFDTINAGSKVESKSYETIAKLLNEEPSRIMFFTDNPQEAQAARAASYHSVLVVRPGNAPLPRSLEDQFPVVQTLEGLAKNLAI